MKSSDTSLPQWDSELTHRIPFSVYTGAALHQKELERFFYQGHWCYVGLEAEIPQPGDFKRTKVGERSVIMVRATDGQIHVVENICAHRGAEVAMRDLKRLVPIFWETAGDFKPSRSWGKSKNPLGIERQ